MEPPRKTNEEQSASWDGHDVSEFLILAEFEGLKNLKDSTENVRDKDTAKVDRLRLLVSGMFGLLVLARLLPLPPARSRPHRPTDRRGAGLGR